MRRFCNQEYQAHNCVKHIGSPGAMETVEVYPIFKRSFEWRILQYVDFYCDGDSKGYDAVKYVCSVNSATIYECIGPIHKRVGSSLRKLNRKQKSLQG